MGTDSPTPTPRSWLTIENREAPESPGNPQAGPLRQAWGGRHPLQNPRLRPRGSRSPRGPAWRPPHLSTPCSLRSPDVPADPRDHCSPPRCPRGRSRHATPRHAAYPHPATLTGTPRWSPLASGLLADILSWTERADPPLKTQHSICAQGGGDVWSGRRGAPAKPSGPGGV